MPESKLKYNAVLLHDDIYAETKESENNYMEDAKFMVDLQVPCPRCAVPADTFYAVEGEGPEVFAAQDAPPDRYVCGKCAEFPAPLRHTLPIQHYLH